MSKKWNFSRAFLSVIVAVVLTWGTMLVKSATLDGREGNVLGGMFESVCLLVAWLVAIQIGGKAWKEFMPLKWGGDSKTVTHTKTEITEEMKK